MMRPESRIRIASSKPCPSSPMRFSSGSSTASKRSSDIEQPCIPILSSLRTTSKPSTSVGTKKTLSPLWRIERSVTAKRRHRPACLPLVMKRFKPLMR